MNIDKIETLTLTHVETMNKQYDLSGLLTAIDRITNFSKCLRTN